MTGARRSCELGALTRENGANSGLDRLGPPHAVSVGMNPKALELQARTRRFATAVINFCEGLPTDFATEKIVEQLLDSAGSTDSNYRATCRARSVDEFIAKVGVAAEEADESKGWLELLVESKKTSLDAASPLIEEADELTAIFVASRITAEKNKAERQRLERQTKSPRRRR